MIKKILIITPILPFPIKGADQADRAEGMIQLKRLGFEVRVISKVAEWQSADFILGIEKEIGIKIIPVPYRYLKKNNPTIKNLLESAKISVNPFNWDGATREYSELTTQSVVANQIKEWQPNLIWCDYTYLWPIYRIAEKNNLPIITRSINFEPIHFLQEDGYGLFNIIKSLPKFISEYRIISHSSIIFTITPKEEKIYKILGGKNIYTLPLRSLPKLLKPDHQIRDIKPLEVIFMGSTYSVTHNKKALRFIMADLAPYILDKYPGQFNFNILGNKMPENYLGYIRGGLKYHGFVEDLNSFLSNMDIALAPSFLGAGMQQKIFEPLCRGIPTITSRRGIANYPFLDGIHIYFADSFQTFVDGLLKLREPNIRKKMSAASIELANKLFSQQVLDDIVTAAINQASVETE